MQLTFSKFGRQGRLGNQLFQLASMIGFSKKYGRSLVMPQWEVANYLEPSPHFTYGRINAPVVVDEPVSKYHYSPDYFDGIYSTPQNVDVNGWLQTEKYWLHCHDAVMSSLRFKQDVLDRVSKYIAGKRTLAISVRVGDYFGNENYEWLSAEYFYLALLEHFPNWKDYNILIFSDDIPYCKIQFAALGQSATFVEGLAPMEQLALGSLCHDFIIANSTFAWWLAYLGLKPDSKVIRPNYHFDGPLLRSSNWSDYYPEDDRYITFDHKPGGNPLKLNMRDVTFVIPVHYDHPDRINNADVAVSMLQKYFDTNIIIGEQGSDMFRPLAAKFGVGYMKHGCELFHRTQMLNELTFASKTPIVVNYDADVLIPPLQLYFAAERIRSGADDFVYPYDGRFARVNRAQWFNTMHTHLDVGLFRDTFFRGMSHDDEPSQGGAVMYRKSTFFQSGGENEYFISYAPEDRERIWRFRKLGYNVGRVGGALYHLDHYVGPNSSMTHTYFKANDAEYAKVQQMSAEELRRYISTWGWIKKYK